MLRCCTAPQSLKNSTWAVHLPHRILYPSPDYMKYGSTLRFEDRCAKFAADEGLTGVLRMWGTYRSSLSNRSRIMQYLHEASSKVVLLISAASYAYPSRTEQAVNSL